MTETLEQRLIRHEGVRLKPYKDSLGKLTIGIGRCLDTKGISQEEAQDMLHDDIADAMDAMHERFPWAAGLDAARQDALTEMIFQLGVGGVAQFKNFLAALEKGDWNAAAHEMLDSAWHRQTPERAEELAAIVLNGVDHGD